MKWRIHDQRVFLFLWHGWSLGDGKRHGEREKFHYNGSDLSIIVMIPRIPLQGDVSGRTGNGNGIGHCGETE